MPLDTDFIRFSREMKPTIQCKISQKNLWSGQGGGAVAPPPPLKYATALKSTVGGLRIAWSEATTTHNSNDPFPYYSSNRAFASILYSCSSKTKTIQCLPNPSQHVPIYLQYSFRVIRCLSQCVSPIKSLFSPHFCFPWDALGAITLNVVLMEREFDASMSVVCDVGAPYSDG